MLQTPRLSLTSTLARLSCALTKPPYLPSVRWMCVGKLTGTKGPRASRTHKTCAALLFTCRALHLCFVKAYSLRIRIFTLKTCQIVVRKYNVSTTSARPTIRAHYGCPSGNTKSRKEVGTDAFEEFHTNSNDDYRGANYIKAICYYFFSVLIFGRAPVRL